MLFINCAFFMPQKEILIMLKQAIFEGLTLVSQMPSPELGNRNEYVGASDVAGCMRKAVLNKKYPPEHDLSTLIKFKRGHLAELILKKAFEAKKMRYSYQEELSHPDAPLKAHTDFIFESKKTESIAILEVKSTDGVPDSPYDSWVQQLYFQMGLAAMKYQNKNIRGAILAMDINSGKLEMFNGYKADLTIFSDLVKKGEAIWDFVKNDTDDNTIPTEKSPLCSWCHYRSNCPAFKAEGIPEVVAGLEAKEYIGLKEQQKDITYRIKQLSVLLKDAIINTNPEEKKVKAGNFIVSLSSRTRTSVDSSGLKQTYPDIYSELKRESFYDVLLVD